MYMVYDIEIKKAIPPRDGDKLFGIDYCEGWNDHENMGISVIGYYISWEDRYGVAINNQKHIMECFYKADFHVGFNNYRFDDNVIRKTWGDKWNEILSIGRYNRIYDILRETYKNLNFDPDDFNYKTHSGYSLDAMCRCNLGEKKKGSGEMAPILWQRGKIDEVITYCLDDVAKTKKLFELILRNGSLIDPKTKETIPYSLRNTNQVIG